MPNDIYGKIISENSFEKMTNKDTGLVGIRVDINSPLSIDTYEGEVFKRVVKSPRMDVCASTILKVRNMGYVPIIFAHQGRMDPKTGPDESCISLESHADLLDGMLHGINIHFMDDPILTRNINDFIGFGPGDAVVLENTRMEFLDEEKTKVMEKTTDEGRKALAKVFDPILDYYLVDAFPTSHRADTTMTPHFEDTPVLFGPEFISEYEKISKLYHRLYSSQPLIFGFGGAKFDKLDNMRKILSRKNVIAFFGGIPAQLLLRACGLSLGKTNNEFLASRGGIEEAQELLKVMEQGASCYLPIDFTVKIGQGKRSIRTVSTYDAQKHDDCFILDIGEHTVNYFINDVILSFISTPVSEIINHRMPEKRKFDWLFIQAGPFGKVDEYGLNTLPFLARLLKKELNITVLGGDSAAYMKTSGFGEEIDLILSGGAALSYLATGKIKCIDEGPSFKKYFN
ncbi:MAG: phosphoglycerate kinase [Candidatus Heimdallarchaeota archaeon]|nr:phosphoglycerate kinase [Candidatus Heimdallarchaeota archaeon]